MKLTKGFVLPFHNPGRYRILNIERNLNHVLRVGPMIIGVFFEYSINNLSIKSNLEEMRALKAIQIFGTCLHVVQEYLCGVERVTELALARHAVLEAFRIYLVLRQLLRQFVIPHILLADRIAEDPIGLLHLLQLLPEIQEFHICKLILLTLL